LPLLFLVIYEPSRAATLASSASLFAVSSCKAAVSNGTNLE